MKKTLISIVGGLALLAVAALINGPLTNMKLERIVKEHARALTMLPAANEEQIAFQDTRGKSLTLKDFAGTPVVMNLWASWCPPCVEELPLLAQLHERYGDKLHVIAISVDAEGHKQTDAFFSKNAIPHPPIYWDEGMKLFSYLKIQGLPTTFVLNAEGQTIAKMERKIEKDDKELTELLERLVASHDTPNDGTK